MKDYQIYKKLRPFILKRIMFALLGLVLMIAVLALATFWGMEYPEYREVIIAACVLVGVFAGWKIIRKGESRYRMAQVAVITDIVEGKEYSEINSKYAMSRVKSTFKYASVFGLIKNIIRHRNFRKTGQFFTVMLANMIPYVGTCMMSWIFANSGEKRIEGACHAITNFYGNRKKLLPKIIKAFLKEWGLVMVAFVAIFAIEAGIYFLIISYATDLDKVLPYLTDFADTLELVYDWYFESKGYVWEPVHVMTLIAIYIAWFIKVFSIRAYQMIGIIREYISLGRQNPPSDELYLRLMAEWEKGMKRDRKHRKGNDAPDSVSTGEDKAEKTDNQGE